MKLPICLALASLALAQNRFLPGTKPFLTADAPVVALTHVRVIDGTGTPPLENQTIVISGGKIAAMGPGDRVSLPTGAQVLDLSGQTAIPGMVGMHEHLFYPSGGGIDR